MSYGLIFVQKYFHSYSYTIQATEEDYNSLPIAEFGKAVLKGMGWKPGEAIGLTNKGSASIRMTNNYIKNCH